MATYVLIHGGGGDAWYWHLVVPKLQALGHEVVAVDLPCDSDDAGLQEYTDTVVQAVDDRPGLIVVAQSLGGFTAALVCDRLPVQLWVTPTSSFNGSSGTAPSCDHWAWPPPWHGAGPGCACVRLGGRRG